MFHLQLEPKTVVRCNERITEIAKQDKKDILNVEKIAWLSKKGTLANVVKDKNKQCRLDLKRKKGIL